jgi:ribosomal subunit interface protein
MRSEATLKIESQRAPKNIRQPIDAQVVFSREGSLHRVDCSVHVGAGIHVEAHATAEDAYASFDAAAERVEKRLRRYNRCLRNHHKSTPIAMVEAPSYVLSSEEEQEDQSDDVQPIIVAESKTDIPTVSVSEAVMRLDLGNVPVLMFRNSAHGGLSVVYRRDNGNFGWIDPKNPV